MVLLLVVVGDNEDDEIGEDIMALVAGGATAFTEDAVVVALALPLLVLVLVLVIMPVPVQVVLVPVALVAAVALFIKARSLSAAS
jgi:hypothetical protein